MITISVFLIYACSLTEGMNLIQFLITMFFFGVIILSDFHGHSWFFEFPLETFKTVLCFIFSAILKNFPSGRFAIAANSVCIYFDIFIKQLDTLRFDVISIVILHGTLINYLNISLLYFNLLFICPVYCPLFIVFVY